MRAYIFVDDGYPEADDYDSNYIFYNPADPESYRQAVAEAERRRQERSVRLDRTESVYALYEPRFSMG